MIADGDIRSGTKRTKTEPNAESALRAKQTLVTRRMASASGPKPTSRFYLARSGSTLLAGLAGAGKLKIVAAIYHLETGVVTYID